MSTLSAFPFLGEQSFATPGAWNSPLSIISANIAAINADVGAISGVTISPPSGNTIQIPSDLSISGYLSVGKGVSIGTQAPSIPEPAALTIGVNSGVSDYFYLNDTANLRSDYLIGSHAGGTADGLNIFDVSGNTMIVSFSKQSIRFYQNVVGPVFDVGGALASTYNAGTFGTGAQSVESRIQAAISQATADGVSRVYVPANMYPYSAASMSFDTRAQMVREGGDWSEYDVWAYGARHNGIADDAAALVGAITGVPPGGRVRVPPGSYVVGSPVTISGPLTLFLDAATITARRDLFIVNDSSNSLIRIQGSGSVINSASSNSILLTSSGLNTLEITDIKFSSVSAKAAGSAISAAGTGTVKMRNLVVELQFDAILIGGALSNVELSDIVLSSISRHGITQQSTGANFFYRHVISDNAPIATGAGFIWKNGNGVWMTDCDFLHWSDGISINPGTGQFTEFGFFKGALADSCSNNGWNFPASTGGKVSQIHCVDCWAAANSNYGVNVSASTVSQFHWIGGKIRLNADGVLINGGTDIAFLGSTIFSNRTSGILIAGDQSNWAVEGCRIAGSSTGIYVLAGSGNSYRVIGNDLGNNTTAFNNGATGLARQVMGNLPVDSVAESIVTTGTALLPSFTFASERSLGWYRSGASMVALSYGTLSTPQLSVSSGVAGELDFGRAATAVNVIAKRFPTGHAAGNVPSELDVIIDDGSLSGMYIRNVRDGAFSAQLIEFRTHQGGVSVGTRLTIHQTGSVQWGLDGTALAPTLTYSSESSLGVYRSGVSTIAFSYGTVNLATNAVRLSMRTLAASSVTASAANTNVATNEVVFTIGGASGASLCISSGGTTYIFSSALSAKNT